MLAEQLSQLVADDFHDLLVRRELEHDLRPLGLRANLREQLVSHADVDVAIEQRLADLPHGCVQVFFRELSLPAEVLEDPLQFLGQVLKHVVRAIAQAVSF